MFTRHALLLLTSSLLASLLLAGCGKAQPAKAAGAPAPAPVAKSSGGLHAALETDKGVIEIEFYPELAPKAVENFRLLAEKGFYNGLTFHRIVKHFMLQGGDPAGDGTGGESAWGGKFEDEIPRDNPIVKRGYRRGILAMANSGPNSNTSQFFIMHKDYPLPPNYVIFANVTKGMEAVDALAETPVGPGPMREMSKPLAPVVIRKVTIKP